MTRRALLAGLAAVTGVVAGAAWPIDRSPYGEARERPFGSGNPALDDTEMLNAMFARGGEVVVPARTYSVSVDETGTCLVADVPGTHIRFEKGAAVRLRPTALGGYVILAVSAPDCRVTGGTLVGDVRVHEGEEGEWGHGLALVAGADRCVLQDVRSTECWGDGFFVSGAVTDVELDGCVGIDNRRQGLSIVDAVRPHVRGGMYGGTGRIRETAPSSGIDLEPNPRGAVVEAVLDDVSLSDNRGNGLLVSARHGPVSATVIRCVASRNRQSGYLFDGPGTQVLIQDSAAADNARGLAMSRESTGISASRVTASANGGAGFVLDGTSNHLIQCVASGNGASGFLVPSTARGAVLTSCSGVGNSAGMVVPDFDIGGPSTRLISPSSTAGAGRPSSAVVLRASAFDASVHDPTWTGPYGVAPYQDLLTQVD